MWLPIGRHAQFGTIVWEIAAAALAIGSIFLVVALRLIRRPNPTPVLATAIVTVAVGYSSAYSEPVFAANGGLNRGNALALALVGVLLGVSGAFLIRRPQLARLLLLVAASGILFGDVAGWIHRSTGPSKIPIAQPSTRPAAYSR